MHLISGLLLLVLVAVVSSSLDFVADGNLTHSDTTLSRAKRNVKVLKFVVKNRHYNKNQHLKNHLSRMHLDKKGKDNCSRATSYDRFLDAVENVIDHKMSRVVKKLRKHHGKHKFHKGRRHNNDEFVWDSNAEDDTKFNIKPAIDEARTLKSRKEATKNWKSLSKKLAKRSTSGKPKTTSDQTFNMRRTLERAGFLKAYYPPDSN